MHRFSLFAAAILSTASAAVPQGQDASGGIGAAARQNNADRQMDQNVVRFDDRAAFTVKQVDRDTVYVDGGRNRGLAEGMTLVIRRSGHYMTGFEHVSHVPDSRTQPGNPQGRYRLGFIPGSQAEAGHTRDTGCSGADCTAKSGGVFGRLLDDSRSEATRRGSRAWTFDRRKSANGDREPGRGQPASQLAESKCRNGAGGDSPGSAANSSGGKCRGDTANFRRLKRGEYNCDRNHEYNCERHPGAVTTAERTDSEYGKRPGQRPGAGIRAGTIYC